MLRRFLRSIGKGGATDEGDSVTYAEELLATARELVGDGKHADSDEPLPRILDAVLAIEAQEGMPDHKDVAVERRRQFTRSYLQLLLDNDALAPHLQLDAGELKKPRGLLQGFFLGTTDVQREAQTVLRFIERKFSEGYFAQAALLLQLFDTEPSTRRNNERNLFYERMILRFMSKRERAVPANVLQAIEKTQKAFESGDPESLARYLKALDDADIRFHIRTRRPNDEGAWREALDFAEGSSALDNAVRIVTPPRWRELMAFDGSLEDAFAAHWKETSIRAHVTRLIEAIYFIVLATGRTGFEPLILRFLDWLDETFDCTSTRLLPDIHRKSTLQNYGINESIDVAYQTHLSEPSSEHLGHFEKEAITKAIQAVNADLITLNASETPAGDYDYAGLVLDQLLGVGFERLSDRLRIHRLT